MKRILGILWVFVLVILLPCSGVRVYGTTIAFYSDGVIEAGDEYDRVELYDTPPLHTTVNMTGGTVGTLSDRNTGMLTHDASTVNISGGIVEFLETYDSSTVNVSGGYVGDWCGCTGLGLYDSSTLNVYGGGTLFGGSFNVLELTGSSKLNVYGGDLILLVMAQDFSTVNVQDGYVYGGIELHEYTTINMYGGGIDLWSGFLGNIDVPETAAVNIYGRDFVYDPQGQWRYYIDDPDNGLWTSRLTGLGFDGTPITYLGLPDPETHPNINLIPEPSMFVLLSLGWVISRRRR